jgi:hypothetical protein
VGSELVNIAHLDQHHRPEHKGRQP